MFLGDPNVGMMNGGSGGFTANAVKFTAARDLRYSQTATMGADSPFGSLSGWFRFDGTTPIYGANLLYMPYQINILWDVNNAINVTVSNVDQSKNFQFISNSTIAVSSTWHHIAISWDTNHTAGNKIYNIYIDGASVGGGTVVDSNGAFSLAYTSSGQAGKIITPDSNYTPSSDTFNGAIAELWFAPGQFVDFSVSATLQKFRSSGGKPVSLGIDGSTPTGTAPKIYLNSVAATCGLNAGTGGNLTIVGTPTVTAGP